MPQPLAFPLRQELVRRHQQGETLAALAQSMQIPPATVRNWWQRFRRAGEAGLATRYQHCGPQGPKAGPVVHHAALALKREHPTWGAGLIRLELQKQFPAQPLPQVRGIQRWFQKAGLQPPRARRPPMERQRGRAPHEVWEVDAKERMYLADGSPTSVLAVTDEASGALLGATPFPPCITGVRSKPRRCRRRCGSSLSGGACRPGSAWTTARHGGMRATCRRRWGSGGWGWGSA